MKAKIARKAMRQAKPMRKIMHGKKQAHATARAGRKEASQTVPAELEMITAAFEAPSEFVAVNLEPVVEVFEVYEAEGLREEDEN